MKNQFFSILMALFLVACGNEYGDIGFVENDEFGIQTVNTNGDVFNFFGGEAFGMTVYSSNIALTEKSFKPECQASKSGTYEEMNDAEGYDVSVEVAFGNGETENFSSARIFYQEGAKLKGGFSGTMIFNPSGKLVSSADHFSNFTESDTADFKFKDKCGGTFKVSFNTSGNIPVLALAAFKKKELWETAQGNAKAVHQWLLNAKTIRAAGIDMDPSGCFTKLPSAESAVDQCFSKLAVSGGPFETFKNPFDQSRQGPAYIRGIVGNKTSGDSSYCDISVSQGEPGDIFILANDNGSLNVYLCSHTKKYLKKVSDTISNF